ncbi:uncharacterized protein J8A68_004761 [[Candida] subhashii]|uniref:Zn(2)-C6 fungal-type domain-containing protein n=1 Tax=[Candida] subhashii TaxID=561895 RepID=A0A8J5QJQ3_9ASCO|nr:uncharacterized protein J8A68_004761 [[Candida] subhashii]KAG7661703.1 hypothetical protein J8A68_004761 [[Candida] subhashii]
MKHQQKTTSTSTGSNDNNTTTSSKSKTKLTTPALEILDDGKIKKVQKSRQRKILSCVYCHSKKTKCSKTYPACTNCIKLGFECKYFINERISRGGKKTARLSDTERQIRGLVEDGSSKESTVMATSVSQPERSPPKTTTSTTTAITTSTSDIDYSYPGSIVSSNAIDESPPTSHHEELMDVGQFNSYPSSTTTTKNAEDDFDTKAMVQEEMNPLTYYSSMSTESSLKLTPNDSSSPNQLSLINQINNAIYEPDGSSTSSASTSKNEDPCFFNLSPFTVMNSENTPMNPPQQQQQQQSTESDTLISVNQQPNNPGLHNSLNAYPSNPATTVNYLYGTNSYYSNENLLVDLSNHLPNKARSFELIERYVKSVHVLLPIVVNLSDFLGEHDKYWNHLPDDFNYLQFYTLYFPILYAATISEFEEYDNLLLNQDIDKYLRAFNKICQYYNYPHGIKHIPLLLGNVIIQSTSPNPSTMEMSQIIRYAKFLQFHKDPIITLRIQDWEVIKFRRMLWWVIFGLDALTSHNFCLPPVCRIEDFNVTMPEATEPIFNNKGIVIEKRLNVGILSMNIKFHFDRILSELVYSLHNGLSSDITDEQIQEIKTMIKDYYLYVKSSIAKMNDEHRVNPPASHEEVTLCNFVKNHSWSYVDRALMLLHKKILFNSTPRKSQQSSELSLANKNRGGVLSLSQYEDTFGYIQEANIIQNFNNSSISLLKFNQFENFTYTNISKNLIPSILHNLNDFLKYNDFIKYGKYNWYIKRTIPLDSIILMMIIIAVKFKYEFIKVDELCIFVKLINKALFILNRKWFKNEKYKRMLGLTNLVWEYILKKFDIMKTIGSKSNDTTGGGEFFDYQVRGLVNMNELFSVMEVPRPIDSEENNQDIEKYEKGGRSEKMSNEVIGIESISLSLETKAELSQLNEKIYYDLRHNFVDINDYCAFYTSLENILRELMDYMNE